MSRKNKRSLKEKFALKNSLVKEALSEFLGTFILIALGCGCVGQAVLSRGTYGGPMTVSVGFAVAVVLALYVSGGVSGGHINPAVSLAMCVTGRLKWTKLPIYILAQFLGAFVGAAAVFGIYYDAFMDYSNGTLEVTGPNATAHIFATYPAPYLSLINGFADQVMSTAVLLLAVFAIFDTKNNGVPKGLEPIAVGLLIIVLTCSLGMNSGCAMNPARDLGPRLFTAVAGWGMEVFTAGNNWWWVPIVAPMLGGVLGAVMYIVFIEIHHPDTQPGEENDIHANAMFCALSLYSTVHLQRFKFSMFFSVTYECEKVLMRANTSFTSHACFLAVACIFSTLFPPNNLALENTTINCNFQ